MLRELREAKNITQKELAEAIGTTAVSISRYETGAREIPPRKAKQIAAFFDIPWHILYEDDPGKR